MNGQADNSERADRLVEAAVAVLQAVPDHELNIVVLNKALFYLDLVWLRDHGELLTQSPYIALPQGPVVAGYQGKIVKALERRKLAIQKAVPTGRHTAKPMKLVGELKDFRYMTPEAVKLAASIANQIKKLTSKAASDYSHRNPGWRVAIENAEAGGEKDIDMELAMQQLADGDDPWLTEEPDDRIAAAFERASRYAPN